MNNDKFNQDLFVKGRKATEIAGQNKLSRFEREERPTVARRRDRQDS
jgi:hypothetical protein